MSIALRGNLRDFGIAEVFQLIGQQRKTGILEIEGARPHWGKIHTLTARELRELYPMWERFQRVRRSLDPKGRFLSPYLRRLLEDEDG